MTGRQDRSVLLVVIGLAFVVLVNSALGVFGFLWMNNIRQTEVAEKQVISEKKKLINRMQTTSRERAISLTLMTNMSDPFLRDEEYLHFVNLGAQFAAARDGYIELGISEIEREMLEQQAAGAVAAREAHEKLINLLAIDDLAAAQNSLTQDSIPMQERVFASLVTLIDWLEEKEERNDAQVSERYRNAYAIFILAFLAVAVVSGSVTGLYLARQLSRAQRDLRNEKDRFARAARGSNDGIWEWYRDSDAFYASARWAEMLGCSEGELEPVISTWMERVHPDDRPALQGAIDRHLSGGSEYIDQEHRLRTKAGDWIWCRVRGLAERDAEDRVVRVAGSLTDVTEQKRIETERQKRTEMLKRQQEALLQFSKIDCRKTGELRDSLVELTETWAKVVAADKVSVWFLDESINALVSMDEFDRGTGAHDYGEMLLGDSCPGFMAAIRAQPVLVADDLAECKALAGDVPDSLRSSGAESLMVTTVRSGSELLGFCFLETVAAQRVWSDDDIGFATSVSDMIARAVESCRRHKAEDYLAEVNQRLEERVRLRTEELAEKNRALDAALAEAREASRSKSEFLANMSHEIRTPMNGVLGMLDVLRGTELNSHQLDLAGTAYSSGEMLLHLLNDILDLSKIEAGKLELERTDFDLRDKLESVVGLLAQPAHSKGLEIAAVLPPSVPSWLNGDPTRIRQILTNLVGNAIKFTDRGEVVVTVELEEERGDELWLRFCVRDTGIGIATEAQTHIFDIFSQADGSTTRRYGGSGLGLAISRHLCQLMGGDIGVESAPGKGSNFWFRVCLHRAQHPAPAAMDAALLHGLRAFIVDDNPTNCRVLEYNLAAWGLSSASETNPLRALERLRAGETYDVVLLDMMMPDLTGHDLAERMQAELESPMPRRVMLTSVTFSGCREAVKAGILDACLNKPVRQSTLYNTLLSLFGETASPVEAGAEPNTNAQRRERLLVVEDHPVNQKVACGILRQLGFAADVANNGREAVEVVLQGGYDLVFMDCQMPELDGYEATRELRRAGIRTPIVAMTANAMQGDRERCLDAGMDDYVSKPLKPLLLETVLGRWLPGYGAPALQGPIREVDMFDEETLTTLRSALGEDVDALFDEFFRLVPTDLQELEAMLAVRDEDGIQRLAHRLKGSSGNIGLKAVAVACLQLERVARTTPTIDALRQSVDTVTHAIQCAQEAILNGQLG